MMTSDEDPGERGARPNTQEQAQDRLEQFAEEGRKARAVAKLKEATEDLARNGIVLDVASLRKYKETREVTFSVDADVFADVFAPEEQAEHNKLSADAIIAKFYMRRGRNKKLTLRQHMKDVGTPLSEGYIRKVKWAYDKRHKRGKLG